MSKSVYDYLREMLTSVLIKAFPELQSYKFFIHLSNITPNPQVDLSTPLPFTISNFYSLPIDIVGEKIVKVLEWDKNYLKNNHNDVYSKGFLNFKLSEDYIFKSVFFQGISKKEYFNLNRNDIFLQNLRKLSEQFKISPQKSVESHRWDLLNTEEELKIMRTIAISDPEDLHSHNAVKYFFNQLIQETKRYYSKRPILCNCKEITSMRLLLISATVNRLYSLSDFQKLKSNV